MMEMVVPLFHKEKEDEEQDEDENSSYTGRLDGEYE